MGQHHTCPSGPRSLLAEITPQRIKYTGPRGLQDQEDWPLILILTLTLLLGNAHRRSETRNVKNSENPPGLLFASLFPEKQGHVFLARWNALRFLVPLFQFLIYTTHFTTEMVLDITHTLGDIDWLDFILMICLTTRPWQWWRIYFFFPSLN